SVVHISGRREGVYVLLEAVLPERPPQTIGVLLLDPSTDRGWARVRSEYETVAAPEDAEVLEALQQDIAAKLVERGAEKYLESLEDSLSNVLRVGDRQMV